MQGSNTIFALILSIIKKYKQRLIKSMLAFDIFKMKVAK